MIFSKKPPIYRTIDEYIAWKYETHPLIAGGQKSLLYRFAASFKLNRVDEIEEQHIAFFVGEQLTGFYSAQALKAMRALLKYCGKSGHEVVSWKMATEEHLRKVGRPIEWDMVRKVQHLREGRGLSYNEIAEALSTKLKRKVHRTSVMRWGKMTHLLP